MRYYNVKLPEQSEPFVVTNVRKLHDLPEGTTVEAIVTDHDGSLIDGWEIPVENGKPKVYRLGKQSPKYTK